MRQNIRVVFAAFRTQKRENETKKGISKNHYPRLTARFILGVGLVCLVTVIPFIPQIGGVEANGLPFSGLIRRAPSNLLSSLRSISIHNYSATASSAGITDGDRREELLRAGRAKAAKLGRSANFQSKVQNLQGRLQLMGILPVVVRLRAGFVPEGELNSPIEAEAQRFLIQEAQNRMLGEVTGFDPASVKQYKYLPFVAMRVNTVGFDSLLNSPTVIDIQEDQAVPPALAQSVALIGGNKAWAAGYTGDGQTVAVIDTGVDKNHPFLLNKVVAEGCYSTNAPSQSASSLCPGGVAASTDSGAGMPCGAPGTTCDHGTHVAGIVAGKGTNFSGVAKDATLIAIQTFSQVNSTQICGVGRTSCILAYDSDLVRSLERVYELRNTYKIAAANLSLGGGRYFTNCDSSAGAMKLAIDLLRSADIATIAAAGNNSYSDAMGMPACISTAISVGSTTDYSSLPDQVSSFSNSAPFLNLLAPGEAINSSVPGGGYSNWAGTSMATPHVAGAWALARQKDPNASIPKILGAFITSGVRVTDTRNNVTKPRIQVDAALELLGDTPPSPTAPTAPTSLTATVSSETKIDLSWTDNSSNENGFRIRRRIGTNGDWIAIATVGQNVTTWSMTDAVAGTTYYFTVTAYNDGGESTPSNQVTATTTTSLPEVPVNLRINSRTSTRLDLTWIDNSNNEIGFKIERQSGNNGTWDEIASVGTNTTFFQNSGLRPGTPYSYRISSFNSVGKSAYSNVATETTLPDDTGNGQIVSPSNLQGAAVSPSQINLSWLDRSENESGFRVRRKIGIDGQWATIANLESGATSFQNTGLVPGTTYYYTVISWNGLGESSPSNEVNVSAPNNSFIPLNNGLTARSNLLRNQTHYYQINVPIGATRLAINTTGTGNIDLYVRYGNQPMINIYNHRSISNSSSETSVTSYPAAGDWHIMIVGFSNNISFYNLTATFQVGTSVELPAAPSNLSARVSSPNQVSLSWIDNSSNELLFRLRRRALSDGVWIDLPPVQQNTISYLDNTVTPGTTYFYSVTSINGAGTSAASNEVSVSTSGGENQVPASPTNLVASVVSPSQVNLSWTDNSTNEAGFRVQRKVSGGSTWSELNLTGQNVTFFQDTQVLGGQSYSYRVIGFNQTGDSGPSNEATVTTPAVPTAPTDLRVTLDSPTSALLNWTDTSSNETGFRIWRRTGTNGSYTDIGVTSSNVTSFINSGLIPNTTYTYRLTAFNSLGDSGSSNEAVLTIPGDKPVTPANPTGLIAKATSATQVVLNWVDVSDNETGFRIRRRIGTAGTLTEIGTVSANVNFFTDLSAPPNSTIYYRVYAFNNNGESPSSNEASTSTPGETITLPAPPSGLTAGSITSSQATLTWIDNSNNEVGFRIQRQNPERSGWVEVATVAANTTSLQNTGLSGGQSYLYRVIAFNSGGSSSPSNEVEVVTPEVPTNAIVLTKAKSMTGVLQAGQSLIYRIQVPGEFGYLAVQTRGLGNVDLYLQHGTSPQLTAFTCRSNGSTSNELCTINKPATGDWFVLVTSSSNNLSLYSVVANYGFGTPTLSEQGTP